MTVIDVLKGISAVGIVIYHYGHFANAGLTDFPFANVLGFVYRYGYFLVDLFFIMSGFLFYKAFSQKIRNAEMNVKEFIRGRYLKLFPLFLFTTNVI